MDKFDWVILNCLADDYESMKQIYPMVNEEINMSLEEIVNRLIVLFQDGYVCLEEENVLNSEVLKQDAESDEEGFPRFWFGLSSKGAKFWEDSALKFSGSEKDWRNAWSANLNYKSGTGFVYGTTKEICEKYLKDHLKKEKDIVLDETSLKYEMVDKFNAKYYKIINDGVKISFRFIKKNQ